MQRVEETEKLQENKEDQKRSKTFSEMMEEK